MFLLFSFAPTLLVMLYLSHISHKPDRQQVVKSSFAWMLGPEILSVSVAILSNCFLVTNLPSDCLQASLSF